MGEAHPVLGSHSRHDLRVFIFEVGCNAGWNLKALREISPSMTLCGVDINESAVKEARDGAGFTVWNQSAGEPFGHRNFDLVFTAGLLIHIPLEALDRVMCKSQDLI